METADPRVVIENNLNSSSEQVLDAVRAINRIGGGRGPNGLPMLLPGSCCRASTSSADWTGRPPTPTGWTWTCSARCATRG